MKRKSLNSTKQMRPWPSRIDRAPSVAELTAEQKKADAAAQDWLKTLDAGKYTDCWDSAAKYTKMRSARMSSRRN